jgi:hypothetical protein
VLKMMDRRVGLVVKATMRLPMRLPMRLFPLLRSGVDLRTPRSLLERRLLLLLLLVMVRSRRFELFQWVM